MKLSMVWAVWVAAMVARGEEGTAAAAPGPDCSPALIQELPARIRNMCAALYQFQSALQQYIEENPNYPGAREALTGREAVAGSLFENGVKRQDLDHVFLRFGRRR